MKDPPTTIQKANTTPANHPAVNASIRAPRKETQEPESSNNATLNAARQKATTTNQHPQNSPQHNSHQNRTQPNRTTPAPTRSIDPQKNRKSTQNEQLNLAVSPAQPDSRHSKANHTAAAPTAHPKIATADREQQDRFTISHKTNTDTTEKASTTDGPTIKQNKNQTGKPKENIKARQTDTTTITADREEHPDTRAQSPQPQHPPNNRIHPRTQQSPKQTPPETSRTNHTTGPPDRWPTGPQPPKRDSNPNPGPADYKRQEQKPEHTPHTKQKNTTPPTPPNRVKKRYTRPAENPKNPNPPTIPAFTSDPATKDPENTNATEPTPRAPRTQKKEKPKATPGERRGPATSGRVTTPICRTPTPSRCADPVTLITQKICHIHRLHRCSVTNPPSNPTGDLQNANTNHPSHIKATSGRNIKPRNRNRRPLHANREESSQRLLPTGNTGGNTPHHPGVVLQGERPPSRTHHTNNEETHRNTLRHSASLHDITAELEKNRAYNPRRAHRHATARTPTVRNRQHALPGPIKHITPKGLVQHPVNTANNSTQTQGHKAPRQKLEIHRKYNTTRGVKSQQTANKTKDVHIKKDEK
ncbi:hypothetical protein [Papillibacter cinnamivorans]|uniref:hypothetical protein n=1 Tax=Papillibacter cinnamivorans TaxID=100176 RepID=UPI00117D909B|nr:hypothetical protein [Papillibacter cinnamivorans]